MSRPGCVCLPLHKGPPRAVREPVRETFLVAPNSLFKQGKERVRTGLRRLKNRLRECSSGREDNYFFTAEEQPE